jgi:5,6,7,8-tetrahydromethanopterin hydro-lyase
MTQATLMFWPAQAAVAKVVRDYESSGLLPREQADDIFIIVSVFIEWDAKEKDKVYEYNYETTKLAIARATESRPTVEEALGKTSVCLNL